MDPQSGALVSALVEQVRTYGTGFATRKWSTPIFTVPADQPGVRVTVDNGNVPLQAAFASVPVPANARPADGTDAHMVVYQPATDTMWEFFRASLQADGWHTRYGGRIVGLSTHPGYFRNLADSNGALIERSWWGATATGLPLLGGLITFDDLRRGMINHALSIAVPRVLQGMKVWPAQRTDGRYLDASAIPAGTHFRLDPAVDIDNLDAPKIVKMIARAAKRYGIYVRDTGGAVAMYGQDPTPSGNTAWDTALGGLMPYQVLQTFPWERLQVLPMQISP